MVNAFSITDIGRKRQLNQDYVFTCVVPLGNLPNLFVVADGMGGHQAGDYAIRLTGNAIRLAAPKEAILARMGGDEFLAVLPRADDQAAMRFMEDFQKQLQALNRQEDRAFNVEASCGAVVIHMNGLSTIEECIQRSDVELYRQKERRHAERDE